MTQQSYAYMKRWHHEHRQGLTRIVDATEVTAHVAGLLDDGWSQRAIADAAGLAVAVVSRLSRGEQTRINVRTRTALLAVDADKIRTRPNADGFVLAVGARRRIQALMAVGHRHEDISVAMRAAGAGSGTKSQIVLHQKGGWVTRVTHEAVCAAYDRLSMRPGASAATRARAVRLGYVPPLGWDDDTIDDPAATPVEAADVIRKRLKLPPVDELRWLMDTGESIAAIASRFGSSEDGVLAALRRSPAA